MRRSYRLPKQRELAHDVRYSLRLAAKKTQPAPPVCCANCDRRFLESEVPETGSTFLVARGFIGRNGIINLRRLGGPIAGFMGLVDWRIEVGILIVQAQFKLRPIHKIST
jgi:hypothetical protein